jgi:hypothetical protein
MPTTGLLYSDRTPLRFGQEFTFGKSLGNIFRQNHMSKSIGLGVKQRDVLIQSNVLQEMTHLYSFTSSAYLSLYSMRDALLVIVVVQISLFPSKMNV